METVQLFANDVRTREDVKAYIIEILKLQVIDRAFSGQDVKDLAEAKKIIDISFDAMVKEFTRNPDKPVVNEME